MYPCINISTDKKPKYIWKNEWNHPMISPWGILERFRFLNFATTRDLLLCFGNETALKYPLKKTSRDIIYFEGFDILKLTEVFGNSILINTKTFLETFVAPLNGYLKDHLSICMDCINIGYHSVYHQHFLINRCPFHNTKLINVCPKCGHEIEYSIAKRVNVAPFGCSNCGLSLINKEQSHKEFITQWSQSLDLKIINNKFLEWNLLEKEQLDRITKLYVPYNTLNSWGIYAFGKLSRYVKSELDSASVMFKYDCKKTKLTKSFFLVFNQNIKKDFAFYEYLNSTLLQSYKSILRYIRKHYLLKHQKCLNRFYKQYDNFQLGRIKTMDTLCIYVIAYIKLRRQIEGRGYGPLNTKLADSLQILDWDSFIEAIFRFKPIRNYYIEVIQESKFKKEYPIITWTLNHLICQYVLDTYKLWLKIIEENKTNNNKYGFDYLINQLYEERLPNYILENLSNNKINKMKISWHTGNDLIIIPESKAHFHLASNQDVSSFVSLQDIGNFIYY